MSAGGDDLLAGNFCRFDHYVQQKNIMMAAFASVDVIPAAAAAA